MAPPRKRYLLVGAGTRSRKCYLPALGTDVVAVMDTSATQLVTFAQQLPVTTYHTDDLATVLADTRPDTVVIATPDYAHFGQIATALRSGVATLVEKPMVLNASQAATVIDLQHQTGTALTVAHNMRFMNLHQEIHRLLAEGAIGSVTNAALSYRLRPGHGRSYFTRWHRKAAASGGLAITKGCHHFDLLNWWLADRPATVTGWATRAHFHSAATDSQFDVPEDADIADEIGAVIHYHRGATAVYVLTAHAAWEGYTLTIQGSAGELETRWHKDPAPGETLSDHYTITLRPISDRPSVIVVPRETGTHAGADARMMAAITESDSPPTECPTATDAGYAVAVGDALNRSAARGVPVTVDPLEPPS
jgi:predicted dehydrogenase